jgi:hypothetical protein
MVKYLSFHNFSFCRKILFSVNGKATVWHIPPFFLGLKYGNFGPSFPKRSFVQAIAPPPSPTWLVPILYQSQIPGIHIYIPTLSEFLGLMKLARVNQHLHWDLYLPKWGLFSGHFLSLIERSFKMFLVMGKSKWPIAKKIPL